MIFGRSQMRRGYVHKGLREFWKSLLTGCDRTCWVAYGVDAGLYEGSSGSPCVFS